MKSPSNVIIFNFPTLDRLSLGARQLSLLSSDFMIRIACEVAENIYYANPNIGKYENLFIYFDTRRGGEPRKLRNTEATHIFVKGN